MGVGGSVSHPPRHCDTIQAQYKNMQDACAAIGCNERQLEQELEVERNKPFWRLDQCSAGDQHEQSAQERPGCEVPKDWEMSECECVCV